jgi:formylglycine-generating enzyme required for sulfatase activity
MAQVSQAAIPPERFPVRLADLGFTAHSNNGIEYILPPLCTVSAGLFLMGSDPTRDPVAQESWAKAEQPQHTVRLPAYDIACFTVTVAEYACFVRSGQREPKNWATQLSALDHPVVYVSWHDAVVYTEWLAASSGETWYLPTEGEWEKAARGTEGRVYPWGDTFDKTRCNTKESGLQTTTSVGNYPTSASPYGVQDMAGNVWEWTSSEFLPYPFRVSSGREDADSPTDHVLRGGSWLSGGRFIRAAYRGKGGPYLLDVGFRLVRAVRSLKSSTS